MSLKAVFTATANARNFVLSRGKDIPGEVLRSEADVGFCGEDVLLEERALGLAQPLGFIALDSMTRDGNVTSLVLATKPQQPLDRPLRIATSYPAFARRELLRRDYKLSNVQFFGGKIEGKLKNNNFDAIVDIKQRGATLKQNGLLVRDVLRDDLKMGLVFRKEPVETSKSQFAPWKFLMALNAMAERKRQLALGAQPDTSRKNTMLLLADENRLSKAIGEESAELVRAIAKRDDVRFEAADVVYTALLAAITAEGSALPVFDELIRRNQQNDRN